jgi:hypothetical protein
MERTFARPRPTDRSSCDPERTAQAFREAGGAESGLNFGLQLAQLGWHRLRYYSEAEEIMFKRFAVIGALALALGATAAAPAHAATRFSVGIGVPIAPVAVARAPYPGYVWQPAHYVRTPYGPQWVQGAWVPAPYAYPPRVVAAPRIGFGFSFFGGGRGWRR